MHFEKNSVDITVPSGISLRLFSQPEVLALIGELARKLMSVFKQIIIKKLVLDVYETQKEQLKSKLSNKFVLIKNGSMHTPPCQLLCK